MHQIYDTVAKSGRNDLFESRLRLKTIGSASSCCQFNYQAKFESCIGGQCYSLPPPPPSRKKPPKNKTIFCVFLTGDRL